MPVSRAKEAEIAGRRAQLVRLRRRGVRFDDQQILDLGYGSPASARKDLIRALEQNRDEEAAEVSIYRQQENERLDDLLKAAWPQATELRPVLNREGDVVANEIDLKAVDTVLKLMDRRAKLLGLDMPVKAELSGPNGGAMRIGPVGLAELRNLIKTAGDPDSDTEDETDPAGTDDGDVDDGDDNT
ncbi:hypothetical protein ACWCPT_29990 [Streptomyces sp. NPDC002308]